MAPAEERSVERALAVLRRIYPWMPRRLRYVAPYQEAWLGSPGESARGP